MSVNPLPGIRFSKRVLIVKLGAIGDVIMAIPGAYELHKQGYDIDWVCGKVIEPLLRCYSWINPIPADDKAILIGSLWQKIKNVANLWTQLGFRKYAFCATLYYDRRYQVLTLPVIGTRKLRLSNQAREQRLLPGRHHTDEYLRVLLNNEDTCREQSTSPVRPDRLPLALPVSYRSAAKRRIAIVAGGTSNVLAQQILRRWPIESYVVLAKELLLRNWEVVLLGGPEDVWVKSYFQHLEVTDLIDRLSLPEVVLFFDGCDAVITHDTGPLHLAGLSETALIGIFGPTDPATRVPRRPYAVGIWGGQGFACRPCYDGRDFAPCRFNGCMHQVTPELVLGELDRLLEDRSLGRASAWRIVVPNSDNLKPNSSLKVLS
jgi:heptosyltransferase II